MQKSVVHSSMSGAVIGQRIAQGKDSFALDSVENYLDLKRIGIDIGKSSHLMEMVRFGMDEAIGMDAIQQPVLTANIPSLVQFLQNWLPGFVHVITAARRIDEIVGITTTGSWEDEQVVQGVMEHTGAAQPYNDLNNIPLSSWNTTYVPREVVRFELGMMVNTLESARAARVRVNSAAEKRTSCAVQLEIQRNRLGFYGYNSGNNLTYGFLNDPALPSYVTVANPGSGTTWAVKTFLQIQADLLTALQALRTQSLDTIEPNRTPITLAVATSCVDYLAKTSDFGISVYSWLKQFYPNVRVISAPELNAANGGANVFYLFADKVADTSTDDGSTFIQAVPSKFNTLGVQQMAKGYIEDYSNASAGIMVKRPYAVYRGSGI